MLASASFTITHITDGLSTFYEYAQSTSNTIPPTSGWSATVPTAAAGKFTWRREGSALTRAAVTSWHLVCLTGDTGSQGPKGDKGDTGAQGAKGDKGDTGEPGEPGPMGNPGAVGVNTDGANIQVAGFDEEGSFGANTGVIYAGTQKLQIPFTEYTCTRDGKGYIAITSGSTVEFLSLSPAGVAGQGVEWKDFNTDYPLPPNYIIGRFTVQNAMVTEASLDTARPTDIFIKVNLMELLIEANETGDDSQLKTMAMALGADQVFKLIVADTGVFRDIWVNRIQSDKHEYDSSGYLSEGFVLDGISGEARIANLIATRADVVGSFSNTGFRTLEKNDGASVDPASISPTIYRQSEMYSLIPTGEGLQSVSGKIEGHSFTQAVRKNNEEILLHRDISVSELNVGSGEFKLLKIATPSTLFGRTYRIEWHIHYNGTMGSRMLLRVKANQSQSGIRNDWYHSVTHEWEVEVDGGTETRSETTYPNRPDMELWNVGKGSGTYSGTYTLTSARPSVAIIASSGALWGNRNADSQGLTIWTGKKYNSAVLVSGSSLKEIVSKPDVYYLASGNPFSVGSTNQNSSSVKKYCSGTDFYNRFSAIPVGSVGVVSQGKIEIDGEPYTISRLQKTSDRITFWTDGGEKTVQKFVDGTNTGVHTSLKITQQILFAPIEGGIESMHIIPMNKTHNKYDVGHSSYRFRAGYFINMYGKLTGDVVGNVNSGGAGNNRVWGAVFN